MKNIKKLRVFAASLATLTAVTLVGCGDKPLTYEEVAVSYEDKTSTDIIYQGIVQNEELDADQKRILKNTMLFLADDVPLDEKDIEKLYNKLLNLDMASVGKTKRVFGTEQVEQMQKENRHIIYNRENNTLYPLDQKYSTYDLAHEYFHSLGRLKKEDTDTVYNEGICLVLNDEYCNNGTPSGYNLEKTNATRILTQIVGRDTILKAYIKEDFSIVEEKLKQIAPEMNATDFIDVTEYTINYRELHPTNEENAQNIAIYKQYVDYYASKLNDERKTEIINGFMGNIENRTEDFVYPCFSSRLRIAENAKAMS